MSIADAFSDVSKLGNNPTIGFCQGVGSVTAQPQYQSSGFISPAPTTISVNGVEIEVPYGMAISVVGTKVTISYSSPIPSIFSQGYALAGSTLTARNAS